ncbi:MAG: LytTR family transcriptional regulator DNA-binding domain-containing protein [Lachnospiraceae bacterium]|nr:LytTR family transcriptional regulator DNA-binding domain-containing protein [Lachnospiraceae bacterium]
MKFTVIKIAEGEDEVILKYRSMTPETERMIHLLQSGSKRLVGMKGKTQVVLSKSEILYIESVDGKTFAYTQEDVLRLEDTLSQLEHLLNDINFFRCSKSMILNIDKVKCLRSLPSNRIDATMCNGEHILISRTYASDFRKRLKGGRAQ